MKKKTFIVLLSMLALLSGCKKGENNSEIDNKSNALSSSITSSSELLSENGEVIQNAKPPTSEDEHNLIQKVEKNQSNTDINTFFKAIINASKSDDLDVYINSGIDINSFNQNGENGLRVAVTSGNMVSLKYLIEKGANLNNASDDGIPPLSQAVAIQNFDAVDLILAQDNTDMYFVWGDVWTGSPVYMCVSHADTYTLEQMIKKGLDINHDYSEYGATPIMLYAVAQRKHLKLDDYKQLISFLILNKADINKSDNNGVTPLMLALKHSDIEGFNALIVGGADTKLKDNSGKTAMDYYNEYVKTNFEIYDEDKSRIQSLLK